MKNPQDHDNELLGDYDEKRATEDEPDGFTGVWLNRKDAEKAREVIKTDMPFSLVFQGFISQGADDLADPRQWVDDDVDDKCFFHCHEKGSDCMAGETT